MAGKCILLSEERDTNGEPVGWKKVLRTTDAIKMVRETIDQKTLNGDLDGAEREKKLFRTLIDIEQKQNKP